ncbi:hypothetical protein Droror1_Dr00024090 [Drosera rotundifolia]
MRRYPEFKLIQVLSKSRVLLQHLFIEERKQRSRLALINPSLTIKNQNAGGSFEFVVTTTQHSLRDANNPAGEVFILFSDLAEFLSKATGTAVDWVQMPGMKVIDFCMKLTTKGVIPATYAFVS